MDACKARPEFGAGIADASAVESATPPSAARPTSAEASFMISPPNVGWRCVEREGFGALRRFNADERWSAACGAAACVSAAGFRICNPQALNGAAGAAHLSQGDGGFDEKDVVVAVSLPVMDLGAYPYPSTLQRSGNVDGHARRRSGSPRPSARCPCRGGHSSEPPSPPWLVGLIRIPRRASASRRSISISAFTLRRSATAQRFTASIIAFSARSGNGTRSGPGGRPRWAMIVHE